MDQAIASNRGETEIKLKTYIRINGKFIDFNIFHLGCKHSSASSFSSHLINTSKRIRSEFTAIAGGEKRPLERHLRSQTTAITMALAIGSGNKKPREIYRANNGT